jgi:hypothetical protein
MSRTKNTHFTFLPVLPEQRVRSLHRATLVDAKKFEIIQRYIKENKGNAIMSRATMTEIAHRVFKLAYPHFYTFKNVALRVKDSHLFDLSRVRCEVEKVKRAKPTNKLVSVENTATDASLMCNASVAEQHLYSDRKRVQASLAAIARIEAPAQIETVEDACARIEAE